MYLEIERIPQSNIKPSLMTIEVTQPTYGTYLSTCCFSGTVNSRTDTLKTGERISLEKRWDYGALFGGYIKSGLIHPDYVVLSKCFTKVVENEVNT